MKRHLPNWLALTGLLCVGVLLPMTLAYRGVRTGTRGADTLTGGTGNDRLHDALGSNHLLGGGGDDLIIGAPDGIGDTFEGNEGNDTFSLSPRGGADHVVCGAGEDRVIRNENTEATTEPDCELIAP